MDDVRRTLVRETYDALSAEYTASLKDELASKPIDCALLDRLAAELSGAGPVCDLGCGPGHVGRYLHDRGVDVSGVDLSPAMVERAKALHPAMTFCCGDMLALPDEDETYAGVVSFYAIVHLAKGDLAPAFREMHRVLRPGGVALIAFHVGDHVLSPADLWGVPVTLDWRFFTLLEVSNALASSGFLVEERVEREPYEGFEHSSKRAYLRVRRPLV